MTDIGVQSATVEMPRVDLDDDGHPFWCERTEEFVDDRGIDRYAVAHDSGSLEITSEVRDDYPDGVQITTAVGTVQIQRYDYDLPIAGHFPGSTVLRLSADEAQVWNLDDAEGYAHLILAHVRIARDSLVPFEIIEPLDQVPPVSEPIDTTDTGRYGQMSRRGERVGRSWIGRHFPRLTATLCALTLTLDERQLFAMGMVVGGQR